MMSIKDILQDLNILAGLPVKGEVDSLCFDSREAKVNFLFFAIPGTQVDGHQFLANVQQAGCSFAVVEKDPKIEGLHCFVVEDSAAALAIAAHNFYGKPSKELSMVGITGTNGKTTTSTLLHNLFQHLGYKCGLLSTVVNKIGTTELLSTHTTPNALELSRLLREMVDQGCSHAFMEVSSHALHQKRTTALDFNVAAFTNITHDHLDYHKTFKEYIGVKKSLFDGLSKEAHALSNFDDKNGPTVLQNTKATKHSFALKTPCDFKGKIIENSPSGLFMTIDGTEIYSSLIGAFNAYNLLTVYAVGSILGEDKIELLTGISQLKSVEGRFSYFKSDKGITCIVDYAHTPDALENVLKTLQSFGSKGKIITVVGCGGDRDKTKRPKMAKIAALRSTQVMLTSDNPRTEDPGQILKDMQAGLSEELSAKCITIENRKEAIKTSIAVAQSGDLLLIAGKGHEKYQDINGVKHDFDDMAIAKELLNQLQK
jgi:UDP-N-acetylmuramoyl-L-alanyl-D-glutamate--2,6-diaminopimelate ligase